MREQTGINPYKVVVVGFSKVAEREEWDKPGFKDFLLRQIGGNIPVQAIKDRNATTFPNGLILNSKWFLYE